MTLQELFEKYKVTDEDQEVVNSAIQAEKDRGISESKKKGKEILEKVTALNKLRDIIKNNLELDPDGDLDEQIKALKENLQKGTKSNSGDDAELKKLVKQVDALQKQLTDAGELAKEAKIKLKNSKLSQALLTAIGDSLLGKDLVVEKLIRDGKVDITDDDTVVFVEGEDRVELAKGLEKLRKDRPDLVRNSQAGGSGGGGARVTVDNKGKKYMTQADFEKLDGRAQREFLVNQKGEIT